MEKSKDEIYLEVAQSISQLSKVEGTKSGSVIIAADGSPVSFGIKGTLAGIDDSLIPQGRETEDVKLLIDVTEIKDGVLVKSQERYTVQANKYPFIYSSESNAIHFSGKAKLVGATLYTLYVPCVETAKEIVRSKIARVVCPSYALSSPSIGSSIGQDFNQVLAILATGGVSIKIGDKEYKPQIIKEEHNDTRLI